jgi:hypothetical protein
MTPHLGIKVAVSLIFCVTTPSFGAERDVVAETREFDVLVDDKPVGVHTLRIRDNGERTVVEVKSDVTVRVLFYRYTYAFEGKETWDREQLVALEARTNDNGKRTRLQFKRNANRSVMKFQQQVAEIPPPHQTTSYTRLPADAANSRTIRLLNVDDGELASTTWTAAERGDFPLEEGPIRCRKWIVDGDVKAELWFDDAGWLVQQKSIEQGHRTELRLTAIRREQAKP